MSIEISDIETILRPYMNRARVTNRYPISERTSKFESELHAAALEIQTKFKPKDARQKLEEAYGGPIQTDLTMFLERSLASLYCRQPDMSGDQRKRLSSKELRAVENMAKFILEVIDK